MITYCGAMKSGLICWDETLHWEKAFQVFKKREQLQEKENELIECEKFLNNGK